MPKTHIVAVTAVIRHPTEEKALMIKRPETEIAYPGYWAWPGGKVETGETATQALEREVAEEVGLETRGDWELVREYAFTRPDGHSVVGFAFSATAKTTDVTLAEGFGGAVWVEPDTLEEYTHVEGMESELDRALGHEGEA